MMPETGDGAQSSMAADRTVGSPGSETPSLEGLLNAGASIGQALRALREAKGLPLESIVAITRVRRAYLQAIEDMALDKLPSGPFAAGYVRAYAQALGARPDLALAKLRQAAPRGAESMSLQDPLGVRKPRDARLSWLAGACFVVVTMVGAWNLAQHAVARDGSPMPPVPVGPAAPPAAAAVKGPVDLAAPQPAPTDSDVPTPYVTPGMAKAVGDAEPPAAPVKIVLNPHAAVYGAPANQSALTLQALRPASLIIRGADGSIYFARQLAAGEAYRAPAGVNALTIDVSDPQAFSVIVNGQAARPLPAAQTPIEKLAG
jgi:transcriptional regulator with XRE-family HTH domain